MSVIDTRQAILLAAAHEFLQHGYAGSSMSAIAGRRGLTKGALAHHFPHKESIAHGIVARLREVLAEQAQVALDSYPSSGIRSFATFVIGMGDMVSHDVRISAATVLLADPSAPTDQLPESFNQWVQHVADFLSRAQDHGEISHDIDAADVAENILIMMLGSLFFGHRAYRLHPGGKRLNFLRMSLKSMRVTEADAIVDEVRDSRGNGALGDGPLAFGLYDPQ